MKTSYKGPQLDIISYAEHGIVPKQRELLTATVYSIDKDGMWLQPDGPAPSDIYVSPQDLRHFHAPSKLNIGDSVSVYVVDPEDEERGCALGSLSHARRITIRDELPAIAEETEGTIKILIGKLARSKLGKITGLMGLTETRVGTVEVFVPAALCPSEYKDDLQAAVGLTFNGSILNAGKSNLVCDLGPALGIRPDYEAAADIQRGEAVKGVVESFADNGGVRILLSNGSPAFVPSSELGDDDRKELGIGSPLRGVVLQIRRRAGDVPAFQKWRVIVSLKDDAEWVEFAKKTRKNEYMLARVVRVMNDRTGSMVTLAQPDDWPGIVGRVDGFTHQPAEGASIFVKRGTVNADLRRLYLDADVPLASR